ncbi:MAG: hypothetical protein R3F34_08390 [Planctomycetota bacterium]
MRLLAVAATLLLSAVLLDEAGADAVGVPDGAALAASAVSEADPVDSGWQVRAEDNIVGLSDAKTLSNPAVVDYDKLMAATPEMQKLKKDRIDPNSPEGIQLTTAAQQRVQRACQAIMTQEGHCSVWKAISHTDGRQVPDITALVKKQL